MTAEAALEALIRELQPLVGGRVQRVHRLDPLRWVFELRLPGRTLRLLVEAGPGHRVHLVDRRPARDVDGGDAQRRVRKRLVGQAIVRLSLEGRVLVLDAERERLELDLRSGDLRLEAHDPIPAPPIGSLPDAFPLNERAARGGAAASDRARKLALRRDALVELGRRRKKVERRARNIEGDVSRLERLASNGERGELLKSVLHRVERGATEVTASDWSTGEEVSVSIPLAPDLSPTQNLERLFAQAKRGQRGLAVARPRLDAARAEVRALEETRREIEALDVDRLNIAELRATLGERAVVERATRSRRADPLDRWSRRFVAADGAEIRVGRGAKENDRLTLQGARGHDRWLHVRGGTGAHVVLRCEPGRDPSPEAVLDAAHLAIHYSVASKEARADVIVAEARHVKKTKGAPPGLVGVSKSRTLHVVVEPDRLKRLMG